MYNFSGKGLNEEPKTIIEIEFPEFWKKLDEQYFSPVSKSLYKKLFTEKKIWKSKGINEIYQIHLALNKCMIMKWKRTMIWIQEL